MIRVIQDFRPNPEKAFYRKCPICGTKIHRGQTVIWVKSAQQFHRRCLTVFLDRTYDQVSLQPDELEGHALFPELAEERLASKAERDAIRSERERAAFEEYRLKVASKLGVSTEETHPANGQLEAGAGADSLADIG